MEIDIRVNPQKVDTIRVADINKDIYIAEMVCKSKECGAIIKDSSRNFRSLQLIDAEHARNLIKAIEKAIEFGWVK